MLPRQRRQKTRSPPRLDSTESSGGASLDGLRVMRTQAASDVLQSSQNACPTRGFQVHTAPLHWGKQHSALWRGINEGNHAKNEVSQWVQKTLPLHR